MTSYEIAFVLFYAGGSTGSTLSPSPKTASPHPYHTVPHSIPFSLKWALTLRILEKEGAMQLKHFIAYQRPKTFRWCTAKYVGCFQKLSERKCKVSLICFGGGGWYDWQILYHFKFLFHNSHIPVCRGDNLFISLHLVTYCKDEMRGEGPSPVDIMTYLTFKAFG